MTSSLRFAALASLLMLGAAAAQPAPDPRFTAAQQAFEALAEPDRRAIQADLIWTGDFTGTVSGSFGPLTFRGIQAFEKARDLGVDGILDPRERTALDAAARTARDAVRFTLLDDPRTGVRLGVPERFFTKRDVTPAGGSRWQNGDGRVTLDTRAVPTGEGDLAQLFERATAATVPGRKVTYKLLRPDFYVVAGETPTGRFYSRMASGPAGLRGFSIGYDKALEKPVDLFVIAIANSFEPFPATPLAVANALQNAPAALGGTAARPPISPASPIAAPAQPRERAATGLVVAPGRVLTAAAAVKDCRQLRAGPRLAAATVAATDEASGLALLAVEGMQPRPVMPAASGATVVVLAQSDGVAAPKGIVASPGEIAAGAPVRIVAALQPGAAGAPVFDRTGGLAGLIAADPSQRFRVAGVVPSAAYRMAGAAEIDAFLAARGVAPARGSAGAERSAGALAADMASSIVALSCGL